MTSTASTLQAAAPPVGLVEVTTSPRPSTATHSNVPGHETAAKAKEPTCEVVQAADPAPGSVDVTTLPAPSVTTQSEELAHETERGWPEPAAFAPGGFTKTRPRVLRVCLGAGPIARSMVRSSASNPSTSAT